MAKVIDTLVKDIDDLFVTPHEVDPERVKAFGVDLAETVARRMAEDRTSNAFTLRMSNIGKPDRQLWYDSRIPPESDDVGPSAKRKFLFGDLLEHFLLFLAAEAGHDVQNQQRKVEVNGIEGSLDATIDGVVVDCKSASPRSFEKFERGTLREDDPFGYYDQLGGYVAGRGGGAGAFLAIEKVLGHISLLQVPEDDLKALRIPERIEHLKEVIASDEIPPRCYPEVPEGESGNMKLSVGCSYCRHKFRCWSDANGGIGLRTFLYSKGPVHFTQVVREPRVMEITF